jgi:Rrf2 family protein
MIKLNRTTEYGLIALRHMSRKSAGASPSSEVTSAREISDYYGLPFEITAKTLQRLRDTGLIQSAQGARGGYTLTRSLHDVSLGEFLELMEGSQSIVGCVPVHAPSGKVASASGTASGDCKCEYHLRCEVKGFMANLNDRVHRFLSGIRLDEITSDVAQDSGFRELPLLAVEGPGSFEKP